MARPAAPAPSRRAPAPAQRSGRPAPGRSRGGPTGRPPAARRRRWLPSWRMVVGALLLLVVAVVALAAAAYATVSVPSASADVFKATTTVYYADGSPIGELNGDVDRVLLTRDQMPRVVKEAAVASEDRTFYENRGVSVSGLGRAVYGVLTGSDLGGGSTITQQYIKNISGNDEHAYTRKAKEAIQALKIDQQLPKDEILTRYLNTIYFGRGAYGVGAAAKAYFDLDDPSQMTAPQAALLIGIVPAPSAWDPAKDPEQAQRRYSYVLQGMADMGYLTEADVAAAPTMPPVVEAAAPGGGDFAGPKGYILAQVQDEVAGLGLTVQNGEQTVRLDSLDAVANAGLDITTTIDPKLQDLAETTMQDPDLVPASLSDGTDRRAADAEGDRITVKANVHGALVSIDPATGGVKAMYAGRDWTESQYDYVWDAKMQAGSTFKPLTLVAALEDGIPLSEEFDGRSPQTIDGYTVRNFGPGRGEQFGDIDLVKATEESVNTVYVQLNEEVGPEATAKVAADLGIELTQEEKVALSNVLGSPSVHPVDMAQAYAALAAGGQLHPAHLVASITRGGDKTYTADTTGTQAIPAAAAADAVYAMQSVVESGTAASVGKAMGSRPIAGKTGTVSSNHAAWFNGFTPQLETAVVFSNPVPDPDHPGDQPLPYLSGKEITGGGLPSTVWASYMKKALKGVDPVAFPKPSRAAATAAPTATATATAEPTATATASPTDEASDEPTDEASDEPSDEATSEPSDDGADSSGSDDGSGSDDANAAGAASNGRGRGAGGIVGGALGGGVGSG